jgi:hypothetical protein
MKAGPYLTLLMISAIYMPSMLKPQGNVVRNARAQFAGKLW